MYVSTVNLCRMEQDSITAIELVTALYNLIPDWLKVFFAAVVTAMITWLVTKLRISKRLTKAEGKLRDLEKKVDDLKRDIKLDIRELKGDIRDMVRDEISSLSGNQTVKTATSQLGPVPMPDSSPEQTTSTQEGSDEKESSNTAV